MTNEELTKYLHWMNREFGQRGYSAGKGPPDMYGNQAITGEEGWSDMTRDQLRTNQFGPNLPRGLGLLSSREDAEQVLRSRLVDNPDYPHIKPGQSPKSMMSIDGVPRGPQLGEPNLGFASVSQPEEIFPPNPWDSSPPSRSFGGNFPLPPPEPLVNPWEMQVGGTDNFPVRPSGIEAAPFPYASSRILASTPKETLYSAAELQALGISGAETGLSAAEIAAQSEQALAAGEAGLEAIEAAEAAGSGWGGPATFAASQALNLIPTRDRDKKVTPFGDEGSVSGILKGTGKGALFGATIGSAFPVVGTTVGAVGGGVLGALGGAQGYFDSTSAPMLSMSRIRRGGGGGMQGGLLGGGSFYG